MTYEQLVATVLRREYRLNKELSEKTKANGEKGRTQNYATAKAYDFAATECEDIARELGINLIKQPYYFTFGSSEQFPFNDGYIVVMAYDIKDAAKVFKAKYPNKQDSTVLNCSDYYSADQFRRIQAEGYYKEEPQAYIE